MARFLFITLCGALGTTLYLRWSRAQAERQLDRMQAAAFDTPGAAAPLPLAVPVVGIGLLGGQLLLARWLELAPWPTTCTLLLGAGIGIGAAHHTRPPVDQ